MCIICVLCLIVVPLPTGENPFAVKINNNNNNNNNNNEVTTHYFGGGVTTRVLIFTILTLIGHDAYVSRCV
jgi:hypothetical protein